MGFFQGTQELVRKSRGKRAISVRATEALLYMFILGHIESEGILILRLSKIALNPCGFSCYVSS